MAWEYVFSVRAMSAWPSRSLTIFGWMPACRARVAWVWRRSWNLMRGSPAVFERRSKAAEIASGWVGVPVGPEKTRSLSA